MGNPMKQNETRPTVSVIIPSLNSPLLDQVLAKLAAQTALEHLKEVLVVGKDEAGLLDRFLAKEGQKTAEQRLNVRLIDTGMPKLAPIARNIGIEAATGELLIFLDSDCLPDEAWLAEHMAAQASGYPVVVGGVYPTGQNYWSLVYNLTLFHDYMAGKPVMKRQFLPSLNLALDQRVIAEVGPMDPSYRRTEDMEWTLRMRRAGYEPILWSAAAIEHRHTRHTLPPVWRDCVGSGFESRRVRLEYAGLTPFTVLLRVRPLLLLASPFIALAITAKIVWRNRSVFRRVPHTIPGIFLTKIAWCWGAAQRTHPLQ